MGVLPIWPEMDSVYDLGGKDRWFEEFLGRRGKPSREDQGLKRNASPLVPVMARGSKT